MRPHAGQARQEILVLRKLHLQLTLAGPGPLGENIQNEAGAVKHLDAQFLRQNAHLGRRQLIVEDGEVAVVGFDQLLEFLDLAVAEEGSGLGRWARLDQRRHSLAPGGLNEGGKLLHRHVAGALMLVHARGGKPCQHRAFFFRFVVVHRLSVCFIFSSLSEGAVTSSQTGD